MRAPDGETGGEGQAGGATAKWHPLKGEYLIRAVRDGILPSDKAKEYLENRHRESIVIIGIESVPGQRNLDAILDVGDIDGIFIGPNDMSTSLGIPDDYSNPIYIDVLKDVISRADARGVPVMITQQTRGSSTVEIDLGARFIMHSSDARLMQFAMQDHMNQLREAAGAAKAAAEDRVETV